MKKKKAIIYCENEFGKLDGKIANGLVRHSEKYDIVGVIDSSLAPIDAGKHLDGVTSGIDVYSDLTDAIRHLNKVPDYFIYGIAPLKSFLSLEEKEVIYNAMKFGMNIISGLPEFLSEDKDCISLAAMYGVTIEDVRKPPARSKLHIYTGKVRNVATPILAIMGSDCAVGKRTTASHLYKALKEKGIKAAFITTGQTGLMQGYKYGIAIDVLTSGFATGEIENAILEAEKENPDIILIEGQGALSHQAFTSSSAIIRGAMPKAIILQHPPKRRRRCDFPSIPMPTLESEIELIEVFSRAKVIAITINHEGMDDVELEETIHNYETQYQVPTTDVLKYGCDKLIEELYRFFPELINIDPLLCQLQD
ncbi:DUF1611 domain-containing protein [Crocinitomicaceae bacterium]|nr:DUF1611 domain-containing protein [Crocinitomicaceae bacterium]